MECASSNNSYTSVTNDTATNATNINAMTTQQTEHVLVTQSQLPLWVSQMMFRLAQIELHLLYQNMKWQNVDAKLLYLFIQYFKRIAHLATLASLPCGPLDIFTYIQTHTI